MCTHNLNEADRLCDRIGIFRTRLIEVDTPQNLRLKLFGRKVVFHLRAVDPAWLPLVSGISGIQEVSQVENKLLVTTEDPEGTNPKIIRALVDAGSDVLFVGELRHSLEDIYMQTMNENHTEVAGS